MMEKSPKFLKFDDGKIVEIPDRIYGTFNTDLNIAHIHEIIKVKIDSDREKMLRFLRLDLLRIGSQISNPSCALDLKVALIEKKKIDTQIEEWMSNQKKKKYIRQTESLIERYKHFPVSIRVCYLSGQKEEYTPEDEERIKIIENYLFIARNYFNINVVHRRKIWVSCECGGSFTEVDGMMICNVCCRSRSSIVCANDVSFEDGDSTETVLPRNTYEDRKNFQRAILYFEGRQPPKDFDDISAKLDRYFADIGFPKKEVISIQPFNSEIYARGSSTKSLIYKALSEIDGGNQYYNDINLLCHRYWNWKLPDLTDCREKIVEDYVLSSSVYQEIRSCRFEDRDSSLSTQYRLYKHLQRVGFPCRASFFKIVRTESTLEYHEEVWAEICRRLGWIVLPTT